MIQAINDFEKITNYKLQSYFSEVVSFFENENLDLIDYYTTESRTMPTNAFVKLKYLISESKNIQSLLTINKRVFKLSDVWELQDNLDNIIIKLETCTKYAKWFRSSPSKSNFTGNIEVKYITKQNESLEDAILSSGSSDIERDTINSTILNDLSEDNYDLSGGVIFKFSYKNDFKLKLNSVVDVITGENIYGKDLDKKIQFVDNDLKILNPKETIEQSLLIILNTTKGSIPEFSNDGVDKGMMSNLNTSFTMFPAIFRQLYTLISKDDTFKTFSLVDIRKEEDIIKLDISVQTRLDEVLKYTI